VAFSVFPYVVPYKYTLYEAANDRSALKFAAVGICIVLPVVVLYLTLGYRVFRGKSSSPPLEQLASPSMASRKTSGHQADLHLS
jgi:cytochrome bd-type quinol oxidase subunit 2